MSKATDTHNNDNQHDGTKNPEQLEREVDQARERLGSTANELSGRLSPGELIDQALGMAREHGGEFGRNLGSQMKNNPMPLILTSVGISWMMMADKIPRQVLIKLTVLAQVRLGISRMPLAIPPQNRGTRQEQ